MRMPWEPSGWVMVMGLLVVVLLNLGLLAAGVWIVVKVLQWTGVI